MTALLLAVKKGNYQVCQALLNPELGERKANIKALKNGENALFLAVAFVLNTGVYYEEVKKQTEDVMKITQLLIDEGVDITCKNKDGRTPLELATNKYRRSNHSIVKAHYKRIMNLLSKIISERKYDKLMKQMQQPVDVIKLYMCGHGGVGKTTLTGSLQRTLLQATLQLWDRETSPPPGQDKNYTPTAGIHMSTVDIPHVGKVSTWDYAGQSDYHPTHSMVLGAQNALYVVMFKIADTIKDTNQLKPPSDTMEEQLQQVLTWLRFIKAINIPCADTRDDPDQTVDKPTVILVASRADWIQDYRREAEQIAIKIKDEAKKLFGDSLNILDDFFILNCHKSQDKEMMELRRCLKDRREVILQKQRTIPNLCAEILKLKEVKSEEQQSMPVLYWSAYYKKVKELDPLIKEDFVKTATNYLHDIGEVLYIRKSTEMDDSDIIILHPDWLCRRIIGPLLATDIFSQYKTVLQKQQTYTKEDITKVLGEDVNVDLVIPLLVEFELIIQAELSDEGELCYIIPGLLPSNMPQSQWKKDTSMEHYFGRRIQCLGDQDIFSPGFFPRLQIRLLKYFSKLGRPPKYIWRNSIKVCDKVEALVYLTNDNRGVHICVRARCKGDIKSCFDLMEAVTAHIYAVLAISCPGTSVVMHILSALSLKDHSDQEDVTHYPLPRIIEADERKEGVYDERNTREEAITELLCPGYDRTLLMEKHEKCDITWMLHDYRQSLVNLLEPHQPIGCNHRMMSQFMGFHNDDLKAFQSRASSSQTLTTTDLMFDQWSRHWAVMKKNENRGLGKSESISGNPDSEYVEYKESSIENLRRILNHKCMHRDDAIETIDMMFKSLESLRVPGIESELAT
ncbi:death-associated protein kinase 1-like [Glandiceps talaboti]